MEQASKKTVLTGVKPTHIPHLGNYLGAIRPSIALSAAAEKSYLFIADYHALTSVQDPKLLNEYTYQVAAVWLACGMDPKKTVVYRQSDVPEIFELAWILSCVTPKGLMNRAHAYKAMLDLNQAAGKEDLDAGVSVGLYTYPVLMSADILMFNADLVPVGEDQTQHIEIARDIAQKFNRTFEEHFCLPNPFVHLKKLVPGLDGKKMSKSYNNHIPLFLESKKLRKLVMKIVTDSSPPEAPKQTEGSIPFEIFKEFAKPEEIAALQADYAKGIGWGEAKQRLFEVLEKHFEEPTRAFNSYMGNKKELEKILLEGADQARAIASKNLVEVKKMVRG